MSPPELSAAPAGATLRLRAAAAAIPSAEPATDSRCPSCGAGFHCGVNDSTACACSTVQLSAAQRADLRQRYRSCLCLSCLNTLPALL